jgi:hypothetical protein
VIQLFIKCTRDVECRATIERILARASVRAHSAEDGVIFNLLDDDFEENENEDVDSASEERRALIFETLLDMLDIGPGCELQILVQNCDPVCLSADDLRNHLHDVKGNAVLRLVQEVMESRQRARILARNQALLTVEHSLVAANLNDVRSMNSTLEEAMAFAQRVAIERGANPSDVIPAKLVSDPSRSTRHLSAPDAPVADQTEAADDTSTDDG